MIEAGIGRPWRSASFALTAALTALAAGALACPPPATAGQQTGAFQNWRTFVESGHGGKVCWASSEPIDESPKRMQHGGVFCQVATWASGAALEQPSLLVGYELREEVGPRATVTGGKGVIMYAAGAEAYVRDRSEETALIAALRKGATLRVDTLSDAGERAAYEFSLKGVFDALNRSRADCGVAQTPKPAPPPRRKRRR